MDNDDSQSLEIEILPKASPSANNISSLLNKICGQKRTSLMKYNPSEYKLQYENRLKQTLNQFHDNKFARELRKQEKLVNKTAFNDKLFKDKFSSKDKMVQKNITSKTVVKQSRQPDVNQPSQREKKQKKVAQKVIQKKNNKIESINKFLKITSGQKNQENRVRQPAFQLQNDFWINSKTENHSCMIQRNENHESKLVNSLLKYVLVENLSVQTQSKAIQAKIPNQFQSHQQYRNIFQFYETRQIVAALRSSFKTYCQNLQSKSKRSVMISPKRIHSQTGFTVIQIFDLADQPQGCANQKQYLMNLALSKNSLVLISKEKSFKDHDYGSLSQNFLFMGLMVTPQSREQLNESVKVFTAIDLHAYYLRYGFEPVKAYLFQFERISTFLRQYIAIKDLQSLQIASIIYRPILIKQQKGQYVAKPKIFQDYFKNIENVYNQSQMRAIKETCLRREGIVLLQGPPGTGKTHTLFAILQGLYIHQSQSGFSKKILVCAPSNNAIDQIIIKVVTKGLGNKKPKLIRVGLLSDNSCQRVIQSSLQDQVRKEILSYKKQALKWNKLSVPLINQKIIKIDMKLKRQTKEQTIKQLEKQRRELLDALVEIKKLRINERQLYNSISNKITREAEIIFCTTSSAGVDRLKAFKGDFEYLIVDESAQSTQPNTLIPIALAPKKIILIGDPMQLPATCLSADANLSLYNRSLFERILNCGVKPHFLDIQYRMAPLIRAFPSFQFYGDRLKDSASVIQRTTPSAIKQFQGRNVIFIDVAHGTQAVQSKSFYNQKEADVVEKLCVQFQNCLTIGIISPYKRQVQLIKKRISGVCQSQVNTIDSFQGQEKDIIIFSCVRSSKNSTNIGFLNDERRINVALTRAKYLLIVVGNSSTLCSNEIWNNFLNFVYQKRLYSQCSRSSSVASFVQRLMNNSLRPEEKDYQPTKRSKYTKDLRKLERQTLSSKDFKPQQSQQVEQFKLQRLKEQNLQQWSIEEGMKKFQQSQKVSIMQLFKVERKVAQSSKLMQLIAGIQ